MKIAITSKRSITSKKDGTPYTILNGFSDKGNNVQVFLTEEQLKGISFIEEPSKETLADVFEMLPSVNVEFNDQGRVEGVSE